MAHGRGALALLALAVVCAVGVAQVGAQRAPAPAPGGGCAVHNPCFNFTRTTEPPNYNTGVGFLYYDRLCTLVDAGTSFCLDPGSGCRRCKTQYAAEVVDVSYPICPRCVCNEFPNAFGCEGQALPPFNGPPAPDCAANAVCFANADVNVNTGLGYEFLDTRCVNGTSLTGCTGTESCRRCKAPSAPASVNLPVCPPCVCRSYYTANACLGPDGEDYYGLGPFPFKASAPAPGPSSVPTPTTAPAPSPSTIPAGAVARCLRTSSPNVDLGVTYQFFSFDCFNSSSKVGCTAEPGCKLCRLEYVATASRGSRRLLQAAAPAPGVDQPICPSYVCDYAPFNLASAQCLPGGSPAPAPGVNTTFVSITAGFTLIGPNGTLIPFNSTRQQAFINSVADALLISTDSITINNYTEATNSTTDLVTLFFTVSTSVENATLLQQQINGLTAGNSDFVLLLNGNGLGVDDVVLQTPASLVTPTAELLSGSYTVCGPTGSLIPFNSTKQAQFEEGLATFINLPGDYEVTPQNITVANYTERSGDPECVDIGFTVSVFDTYVNEVSAQLDSIGDSNGISDRNLIGILNGAGLGVTTIAQSGSVIPYTPAPAPGPASDNGNGGLSGGAIAGIVIGSVVGVLLLLLLLCLCLRRRKRASQQNTAAGASYVPAAKGPQYPSVDVEVLPSGGTTASGPSRGAPRPTAPWASSAGLDTSRPS
eukprot:jgi/Chlat1/2954/Chrsp2S04645